MADPSINELQAKHNYDFLKCVRRNCNAFDWWITIAFYTAVHIAECKITLKESDWRLKRLRFKDPESMHEWRAKYIAKYFPNIYKNYRILMDRCWTVRYLEAHNDVAVNIVTRQDVTDCLDTHLQSILNQFNYKMKCLDQR